MDNSEHERQEASIRIFVLPNSDVNYNTLVPTSTSLPVLNLGHDVHQLINALFRPDIIGLTAYRQIAGTNSE